METTNNDLVELLGESPSGAYYGFARRLRGAHNNYVATQLLPSDHIRTVFVKSNAPTPQDPTAPKQFERERAVLRILKERNATNILYPIDEFRLNGTDYLVFPLLTGRDLFHVCTGKNLTTLETLDVLRGMAPTVTQAHEASVYHNDIKPENLFAIAGTTLSNRIGTVQLFDWGVAHHPSLPRLAKEGFFVGSLQYVPPETLKQTGGAGSPTSDIYATAGTAYMLITGNAPNTGTTPQQIYANLIGGNAFQPTSRDTELLGKHVLAIIKAGLSPDPRDRPDSIQFFVREFAAAVSKDS